LSFRVYLIHIQGLKTQDLVLIRNTKSLIFKELFLFLGDNCFCPSFEQCFQLVLHGLCFLFVAELQAYNIPSGP